MTGVSTDPNEYNLVPGPAGDYDKWFRTIGTNPKEYTETTVQSGIQAEIDWHVRNN